MHAGHLELGDLRNPTTKQSPTLLLFIADVPWALQILVLKSGQDPTYAHAFDCLTSIKE